MTSSGSLLLGYATAITAKESYTEPEAEAAASRC